MLATIDPKLETKTFRLRVRIAASTRTLFFLFVLWCRAGGVGDLIGVSSFRTFALLVVIAGSARMSLLAFLAEFCGHVFTSPNFAFNRNEYVTKVPRFAATRLMRQSCENDAMLFVVHTVAARFEAFALNAERVSQISLLSMLMTSNPRMGLFFKKDTTKWRGTNASSESCKTSAVKL